MGLKMEFNEKLRRRPCVYSNQQACYVRQGKKRIGVDYGDQKRSFGYGRYLLLFLYLVKFDMEVDEKKLLMAVYYG